MSGYFSRLAHSTGMRIGGMNSVAAHAMMPALHELSRVPRPLEADETLEVGGGGALQPGAAVPWSSGPVGTTASAVIGSPRSGESPSFDAARGDDAVEDVGGTATTGVVRIEQRMGGPDARLPDHLPRSSYEMPALQNLERPAAGEQPATPLEELVIRMIESDPGRPDAADDAGAPEGNAVPRINDAARSMLRDVIGWISTPPEPEVIRSPIEEHVIREAGEGTGKWEEGRAVPALYGHGGEAATARPEPIGDHTAAREPIVRERREPYRPPHETATREPVVQDFTLSIGSIRIVIEEPSGIPQQQPVPAPQAQSPAAATNASEPSRMSRYYI